ncbi:BgtE-10003 [Blumeria graminis f. sp. tritici]|uniref:BgtE-10003 n=2 Tax=Blumeria graminis f. sp. tritici TaxID=62690 RepID=A0A061HMZ6_BLUGR|nr:putative secreted effector protein [Blumeria graminis f. sp. tritici 96224]VDB88320.1 BgtE-10003 [Blumeria graminis f. sp. tritici]
MQSNRLLSCLGIWIISIIGVVQCVSKYYCGNNEVLSNNEVQYVYNQALPIINQKSMQGIPLSDIKYTGNLCGLPEPIYHWFVKFSRDNYSQVVMSHFLLISADGELQGVISTGWKMELGQEDTWCGEA